MAGKGKTVFDIKELVRRLRLGQTERAIGRQMGFHRVTVRKDRQLAESHGWLEKDAALPEPEETTRAVHKMKPGTTLAHEVSSVESYRVLVETLLQEETIRISENSLPFCCGAVRERFDGILVIQTVLNCASFQY
ncbi:MAG: hypothetical protein HQM06_01845 [Magnetococcales bacterium]|nr:hypothetical protein [Magnetococcales bacterium]